MILMQLKNIVKSFAGKTLLHDVQMEVKSKDRIAIVGRNGAGKSTILKIMTAEIGYDSGEIFKSKALDIGYLSQHNGLDSNKTIWDEMLTVFSHLIIEEKRLQEMAIHIEKLSSTGDYDERKMLEYGQRQEQFTENGGYRYKSDLKGVLTGLGFQESDFNLFVNDLSGGQKTRLALGKLLLKEPDLLILDEPTNHLDIRTLTWLENYLSNYNGALVMVSHDRYFLDKIVTIVYEVANQQTVKYHGTYTKFLKQKRENYERDLKMYEKQQEEIKEMEDFIAKNIARASTTKRAQGRRKQLEKLVRIDRPLGDESSASFSFHILKTSGNDVIDISNFSYIHEGKPEELFSNVTCTIHRGERVALIGENGVGKTTLLKALMQPNEHINIGANVLIGYYAQEQELLQQHNTILEDVWGDFPDKDEQEIRTVLGNFLFSGDDVLKLIHTLSGGEKARIALAKLMLKQANFLILDEPTNHLDLASKEVLEAALNRFPGTILFVSHDRYFINKLADQTFELQKNGLTSYLGDYDYYLEKKAEQAAIKKMDTKSTPKHDTLTTQQLSFHEQKRLQSDERKKQRQIDSLEKEIETMETRLEEMEMKMTDPDILQDHEQLFSLSEKASECRAEIENKMELWTELQD